MSEYRYSCECGFVTNAYGTDQAAKDALARHKKYCTKNKSPDKLGY